MEALTPQLLGALDAALDPRVVVLRNDSPVRTLEGLKLETRVVKGELDGPMALTENGARFFADPLGGQKTGWFYDQREARARVAALATGARVLDLYAYTGGFGVPAAVRGAARVVCVDRSRPALDLAARAAAANGVADRCEFRQGDAFETLERMEETFDVVIADPPAFVRSKIAPCHARVLRAGIGARAIRCRPDRPHHRIDGRRARPSGAPTASGIRLPEKHSGCVIVRPTTGRRACSRSSAATPRPT
jgi:23S rRNA G2069 N7-methylase RlmK/C1962 C5-methylase RlmI